MAEPVYSVILRDEDYIRQDELTDWLSFSYVKRFNGVGTWELEVSNLSVSAPLITKTSGIIVTRDGATVFSGSVSTEYTRTATTLRVAGFDDNVLLNVPALPDVDGPPYTTEYDVRTAPQASSVLIQAVQFNIGPNARPDRIVPQLILAANPILGGSVTYRGRFQDLITYMANLASTPAAGGLGFDLMQTDGDDSLTFRVYDPPDKRADAVFSIESLTAQDYEDVYTHPPYNKVFVLLGDGLGGNRSVIEDEDATAVAEIGRRIETVIDARDVTDPSEGNQRAAEALSGAVSSRRVRVEPFQINTLVFGADYDLGQRVGFVIDGESFEDIVTEVRVEFTLDRGVVVTPSIGFGDDADDDARVIRQIAAVDARLTNIEGNYNVPDNSVTRAMLTAVNRPPIGGVMDFAGTSAPAGWLFCDGSAVSRTTYAALFAVIATTYGVGNGTTTFNLPNSVDRFRVGAGSTYALAATGGAATVNSAHDHTGAPHTHPQTHAHAGAAHTHSHAHTGAAHTHPGNHSHPPGSHQHNTDINHDHPAVTTSFATTVGGLGGFAPTVVTNAEHTHTADVLALGTSSQTSSVPSALNTGTDSTAHAASFSGNTGTDASPDSGGSTGLDVTANAATFTGNTGSAGGSLAILPPYLALRQIIYAAA